VKAKALTPDELANLLAAIPDAHRPFFAFMARTGLRVSEAVAVRWSDLDATHLHVTRRFYKGAFAPPKSKFGKRAIPLAPALARDLWAWRKVTEYAADDDLVFPNRQGLPLDRTFLFNRVLKPAARTAGVPWAGFHTLRHTCATMLLRGGLSPKQAQIWLGHHSPAFTLAVYVHLLPEDVPALDVLDVMLPVSLPVAAEAVVAIATDPPQTPMVAAV
jgi:integrase